MLKINKEYLKSHNCNMGKNNPKYIVNHETDNFKQGAGARNHAKAQYNGNLGKVSVHFYVDDKEIYQCLEYKDGPWSVGDANYGIITNWNNISIEICVNPDSDYDQARKNAAELNRYLINELGLGMDSIKRHYDATYKICPGRMINYSNLWKEFIQWVNTGDTTIVVENKPKVATIAQSKAYVGIHAEEVQKKLIYIGYDLGSWGANGVWGQYSYNALLKFQKDNGLVVDGYCGPATTAKLDEVYNTKLQVAGKPLRKTFIKPNEYHADIVTLQYQCNIQGYKDKNGKKLVENGYNGPLTLSAVSKCSIYRGCKGQITLLLQKILKAMGYYTGLLDGDAGTNTHNAILLYQKMNGLVQDGSFGPKCWESILT